MANVFEFNDYREFLRRQLKRPDGETATIRASLARHLEVHSSLLGKILRGEKQLTPDQAFLVGGFFALSTLETEYFVQLVHLGRASNRAYRESIRKRLDEMRVRAGSAPSDDATPLRPEEQFIYYSHWYYSALSLLTAIESLSGPEFPRRAAQKLGIPEATVREALAFLVSAGICAEEDGRWTLRKKNMRLDGELALVDRHLINWRMKAIERIPRSLGAAHFQVYPVALSREAAEKAKEILKAALTEIQELTGKQSAEELYCLNLDWFDVSGS